jgi:hypothetical protein
MMNRTATVIKPKIRLAGGAFAVSFFFNRPPAPIRSISLRNSFAKKLIDAELNTLFLGSQIHNTR